MHPNTLPDILQFVCKKILRNKADNVLLFPPNPDQAS